MLYRWRGRVELKATRSFVGGGDGARKNWWIKSSLAEQQSNIGFHGLENVREHSIHQHISAVKYGICGEFVWVMFLVVCFLHKTNPNPRKKIWCGKKWPKMQLLTYFSWVGLDLGWGVRRSNNIIYMFSNPPEFGKSQTPYYGGT